MSDDLVQRLVEEAMGTCEPENADEEASAYSRKVLARKFAALLKGRSDIAEAQLREARERIEALEADLAEVDALLEEYGIDTMGTGPDVGQRESRRVQKICEKASARFAALRKEQG